MHQEEKLQQIQNKLIHFLCFFGRVKNKYSKGDFFHTDVSRD